MTDPTICGIDAALFKNKPTPDELARVIADWSALDIARFIIALGFEIDGRSQWSPTGVRKRFDIANALVVEESEILDGHGTRLIEHLNEVAKAAEMAGG